MQYCVVKINTDKTTEMRSFYSNIDALNSIVCMFGMQFDAQTVRMDAYLSNGVHICAYNTDVFEEKTSRKGGILISIERKN